MAVALYRIDDRLIHGQVVIGWGQFLGVRLVVLVDDGVTAEEWEQDLYRAAMPPGMDVVFAGTEDACKELPAWEADPRRAVVLTGDVPTMAELARRNPTLVKEVNLGGIHHRRGRTKRLPYMYLTEAELSELQALQSSGVKVMAQDVPSAAPKDLKALS
jgi:PTS system mannose-specific IIB component/fructoselysine and glucoselysine-specific PTS system IIB component